ncbi:MAG: hypothetical protein H6607_04085 [Flavobacteriales bacterium]|nr:hypothetical protein [Flavobacteriales bacterium]
MTLKYLKLLAVFFLIAVGVSMPGCKKRKAECPAYGSGDNPDDFKKSKTKSGLFGKKDPKMRSR